MAQSIYFTSKDLRTAAYRWRLRYLLGTNMIQGDLEDYKIRAIVLQRGAGHRLRTTVSMPGLGLGLWIRPEHLMDRLWDAFGVHDIRL